MDRMKDKCRQKQNINKDGKNELEIHRQTERQRKINKEIWESREGQIK